MNQPPNLFLDLMFAFLFCPHKIEDVGLKLSPACLSVSTAETLCCNIYNWTCTVFASFSFAVVISLIATDLVSPQYIFVHDLLYCDLYSVILIIYASGNLCHSFLLKSYDAYNSNCDTSLHCTIRSYCLLRIWFPLPPWLLPDLPLTR